MVFSMEFHVCYETLLCSIHLNKWNIYNLIILSRLTKVFVNHLTYTLESDSMGDFRKECSKFSVKTNNCMFGPVAQSKMHAQTKLIRRWNVHD